jgi:predicted MPP superfamily phosphohydrolase
MVVMKRKSCLYWSRVFFPLLILLLTFSAGYPQVLQNQRRIYFISDVQEPMTVEKIILKSYRNEEARDSLFADILRQRPGILFMLGDLSSKGSNIRAWEPLDGFLKSLSKTHTLVYVIPGNHEYMGEPADVPEFLHRFPEQWLHGYLVTVDSIAMVMLNSNFSRLSKEKLYRQLAWYKSVMDSLDSDPKTKAIIVCTHHPPFSNSKVVGSSKPVQDLVVPIFEKSKKSKLFISGHSHNLEYFAGSTGKHYLVIGGGGGITQPLVPPDKSIHHDLLEQDSKPLYFYLVIENNGDLKLMAKGFKRDFRFFEEEIGTLPVH